MQKIYQKQQRYDTAANWESANPVLLVAEFGIVSDSVSGEYKVGDGKTPWNGLPMFKHWDGSMDTSGLVTTEVLAQALAKYVEKVVGKDLSTNDFTNVLKQKLESLENYDDAAVQQAIQTINTRIDTLVGTSASSAIDNFNEIEAFLQGITDSQSLTAMLAGLKREITALIPNSGVVDRPATPTSMGYKVLKSDLTFAEQVTEPNTIYEIRDEFDLNKESLTMPLNIVLRFNGGMLKNGYVIGSNTKIDAPLHKIFDNVEFRSLNSKRDGFVKENAEVSIFNNDTVPVEWFGAISKNFWAENPNWVEKVDDLPDSSDAMQAALNLARRGGGKAICAGKLYRIDKTIKVPDGVTFIIPSIAAIAPVMRGSGLMPMAFVKKVDINESDTIVLNYAVKVGPKELTKCVFEYKNDTDLEWTSVDLNKAENSLKIINLKPNAKYEGKIRFTTEEDEDFISKPIYWTQAISSASIYPAEANDWMVDDNAKVIALKSSRYIPKESMAVAIDLNGATGRIEGHGQLVMKFSEYTIGILIRGQFYNDIDMTLHPYCDIRIIGGNKMQTAPDVTDIFGKGVPNTPSKVTHGWYFDMDAKVEYKKELVSEGVYKWSVFRNANPLYNTSMRIDVTQGSDYRLVNMRLNVWDIFGFRGIEVVQSSGWCNDSVWDGTVSNKASNYVSFFGTDVAQHDMRKMDFQSGGEQNDSAPLLYCEAHTVLFGRAWDLGVTKSSPIRFILTKSSYNCTAQWVGQKWVVDEGKNNLIVSSYPDVNNPSACVPYNYVNIFNMRSSNSLSGFVDFNQAGEFYDNILDFPKTWVRPEYKKGHLPGELFDNSVLTYKTLVDTDSNIYASGWWFAPNNGYEGWTNTIHAFIQIDYDINECRSDTDTDIYMLLTREGKKIEEHKLNNGSPVNGRYKRKKLLIPFVGGYERGSMSIIFYTKKNFPNQKLRVFSIKLFVDAFQSEKLNLSEGIFDNNFGRYSNIPDAAPASHIYYATDKQQSLINRGTSDKPLWQNVNTIQDVEHTSGDTKIASLIPNVNHKWIEEISSLTISELESISNGSDDFYSIEFTTPKVMQSGFTLSLPKDIKWLNGKKLGTSDNPIGGGMTYQINITNNLAVWGGFK